MARSATAKPIPTTPPLISGETSKHQPGPLLLKRASWVSVSIATSSPRRLGRSAIEGGLHLLSMGNSEPCIRRIRYHDISCRSSQASETYHHLHNQDTYARQTKFQTRTRLQSSD